MGDGTCSEPGCNLTLHKNGRGFCGKHYVAKLHAGELPRLRGGNKICTFPGCGGPYYSTGWCRTHYERARTNDGDPSRPEVSVQDRFWAKVDKQAGSGCWLWTSALTNNGHGVVMLDGRTQSAHRLAYEWLVGPIPDGLVLDHECHNRDLTCNAGDLCPHRRCVRPDHIRATTQAINYRSGRGNHAKTHCPQGHPYDKANTAYGPQGHRFCRACRKARNAARYLPKAS